MQFYDLYSYLGLSKKLTFTIPPDILRRNI